MKENIIRNKSYQFSLEIIKVCELLENHKAYVLSNQLLKSGTSIGANVRESQSAESKKDFIHKLSIALKESRETDYWLNLLKDSYKLPLNEVAPLIESNNELQKILAKILLSSKKSNLKHSEF